MSLIDIRWRIIPDEIHVMLVAAGIAIAVLSAPQFGSPEGSFVGGYGYLLGLRDSIAINRLAALGAGIGFFGLIFLATLGRGMGLGDVKLAGALGVLFGWPDILLITGVSFIVGTVVALPFLVFKKLRMKSMVPFGPFLAVAALLVYFWGYEILRWYFSLFGII